MSTHAERVAEITRISSAADAMPVETTVTVEHAGGVATETVADDRYAKQMVWIAQRGTHRDSPMRLGGQRFRLADIRSMTVTTTTTFRSEETPCPTD